MLPSLRHPGRVALLLGAAALANACPLPLPAEARLFLGPFLSLPVVLVLPWPWALLAAAIPAAVTIPVLGHPFVLFLAVAEAAWLCALRARWRRRPLVHDGLFWAVAGLPGLAWFYHDCVRLPAEIVAIVAAKQVFNQFGAVAVSVFLLRHTRLAAWLADRPIGRRRMRDTVFSSVFVLAMVPLVSVAVGVSVLLRGYCEREDREVLTQAADRLAQQLDLYLDMHVRAVTAVAGMLSHGHGAPGPLIEEIRRTHPACRTMLVTDAAGQVIASAPPRRLGRTSVADREYFRQARALDAPFISGVFRGRGFGNDILVAISAPLHDASGRFAGVVEASLEVSNFSRLLVTSHETDSIALIIADPAGRVIFADEETGLRPLALLKSTAQHVFLSPAATGKVLHFDQPEAASKRTRLSALAALAPGSRFLAIAQRPLLSALEGSGWVYALFLTVALGILVAAAWVARSTRLQAAAPLEYFAACAEQQAELQRVEPVAPRFPDAPHEVWIVFHAFNRLAGQLQATYAKLRQANEELDARVVARTAEAEHARRQAEAANRSKTEFLAMTSHEIRTPINAIMGLADSLAGRMPDPVAAARLGTIRGASERLLTVVNDLLDLSRVEAGRLELRNAPVELGTLCAEVCALFAGRARQQGLRLERIVPGPAPLWLETDSVRLQQVLINLVGNALKFTRAGSITLRVDREAESEAEATLRFAVIDTGPGIPAAELARLFQPYVQLAGASRSPMPGTGLGLFVSRRLVSLFGGTLAVRSEAGAEFHFTIRVRRCSAPVEEAAESARPAAAPAGLRILAADDNLANQEVLRSVLEAECGRLAIVDDAAAALERLATEEFDVAVVDLEMPGSDGYSVARTVREWRGAEASRGCKLVACSAHARDTVWNRCAASGFDDFVEKPVTRKALLHALQPGPAAVPA